MKNIGKDILSFIIALILISAFTLSIVGLINAIDNYTSTSVVNQNDTIKIKVVFDKDTEKVVLIKETDKEN